MPLLTARMRVCFIVNTDNTGETPTAGVQCQGELMIGTAFDRNYGLTGTALAFRPSLQRAACVDIHALRCLSWN